MRFTRLIIGGLIILVAGFVLIGEQLAGASADAVVNARMTTLRAPIAGEVSLQQRTLGSTLNRGEALGSISDPIADSVRLDDLLREHATAASELSQTEAEIQAIDESLEWLRERQQSYQSERIAQLEAELAMAHAQARLAGPSLEQDAEPQSVRALQRSIADQRVRIVEIALEAAREGRFLGDGFNDAPFSEQQLVQRQLRLAELNATAARQASVLEAITERLAAERLRVNRLDSRQLTSLANGRLWELLADNGEIVQRGQDILRIVNCETTLVTLSVTESIYNRLAIGDPATFRMTGDGRTFDGTITRLAGSGAATIYRNLAITPSQRHLERFDVTLLVPGLRQDQGLSCAIGRTGRVFFEARPLDFLRRIWN
ncbi:MAG: HlyD family secretion protein [Rhizobiaceae bacterium]